MHDNPKLRLLPYNIENIEYIKDINKPTVKTVSVPFFKSTGYRIIPFYKDISRLL